MKSRLFLASLLAAASPISTIARAQSETQSRETSTAQQVQPAGRHATPDADAEDRVRRLASALRARYPDYDRWTVADFNRLSANDLIVMRTFIQDSETEWRIYIPRRLYEMYGQRRAPGVFGPGLINLVEDRGLGREFVETQVAVIYAAGKRITGEALGRFDVSSPVSINLEDGTTRRVPPADVFNYAVRDEIRGRDRDTAADISNWEILVEIPRDVTRGVAQNNPQQASVILPRIQGDVNTVVYMGARQTYGAGVSTQEGLGRPIFDRSMRLEQVTDPAALCRDVLTAEIEIFDTNANDVRTLTAYDVGRARRALSQLNYECTAPLEPAA